MARCVYCMSRMQRYVACITCSVCIGVRVTMRPPWVMLALALSLSLSPSLFTHLFRLARREESDLDLNSGVRWPDELDESSASRGSVARPRAERLESVGDGDGHGRGLVEVNTTL